MDRPRPTRDAAPPALAATLALLALPACGLAPAAWLPGTPLGYAPLALAVVGLAALALAASRRALRVPTLLLAAAPALVLGGGLPVAGWWLLLVAAALLPWAGRHRTTAVGVLAAAAALVLVLGGGRSAPRAWSAAGPAEGPQEATVWTPREGVRLGAALPAEEAMPPRFAHGAGPWWREATRARHPGPRPAVLLVAARRPAGGAWALPEATVVHGDEHAFAHAHELRVFDAVVVLPDAWSAADPQADAKARAVAGFVRKGGLLIGPAPRRPWPAPLGRLLGSAGRAHDAGTAGARRLGLGRVVRAASQQDVADAFAADLWVRAVGVSLLDPQARPAPLATWAPWRDDPAGRRLLGVLLLVHAAALALFTRVLRGGVAQWLGTLLVSAAVTGALAFAAPETPGFRVEGAVVELGGAGGRRIEGVWISAGPAGYEGRVRFRGGGVVGVRGGQPAAEGRLRIPPGGAAWVVRETRAMGPRPEEPEDRTQGAVRALLRGTVAPGRLRFVRIEALPVRVEGWGAVPAAGVQVRAP